MNRAVGGGSKVKGTVALDFYSSHFSKTPFVSSFQRKVEMFHDTQAEFGDRGDGYVSRTIALVNCCPPLR